MQIDTTRLADRLEQCVGRDLRAVIEALRNPRPLIVCGASSPDARTEKRVAEARSALGVPTESGGCGRRLVLWHAFRCVECGRWFHRACIQRHFDRGL